MAVVGSSTRIYSATGGAFTLAYFDALLYDGQSLGGALRQAKNFLLVYALLKEKLSGSGLEPYVEVIATIEGETEKKLVEVFRV